MNSAEGTERVMDDQLYYIVCTKHPAGWNMSFWRPNAEGYTVALESAGKYTMEQVKATNCSFDAQHFPVPCEDIDALAHRGVDRDQHQFKLMSRYLPPKKNGEKYHYGDVA